VHSKELAGGGTLDLGIYCVFLILGLMGEKPQETKTVGTLNNEGTDLAACTVMRFSKGRTATMTTHTGANLPCEAYIVGSKGRAKLHKSFHASAVLEVGSSESSKFPL